MLKLDHAWALREIFDRYHLRLLRLAGGVLHDDELAKDIVQNVFIDLWNRRHSSEIRVLSHYLSRAVKYQVLKEIRDGRMAERHLRVATNLRFVNQTEESINHREVEIILEKAIDDLSPRCREVFTLSRYDNLSHREISRRLNISTKTVEAQIGKALALLREKLNRTTLMVFLFFLLQVALTA